MNTCTDCGRTLVNEIQWRRLTRDQRRAMKHDYARAGSTTQCEACRRGAAHRHGLRYQGGWIRRGLVLVPDRERPEEE